MIDLAAVILTKDEEPNIGRCLEKLRWVPKVLVLDSGSTDRTEVISRSFPNVSWVSRAFDSFAGQCNYALETVASEWVLSMDADYILSEQVSCEIRELQPRPEVCSYSARFVYCIDGKPLRGTLYRRGGPVLYRRKKCRYVDLGHGHAARVEGNPASLSNIIYHDDRKSMERWMANQREYARREVKYLWSPPPAEGWSLADRLRRRARIMPLAAPLFALFAKGVILDGRPGLEYARQRWIAEKLIAQEIRRQNCRK